jgi:hypothetical protein
MVIELVSKPEGTGLVLLILACLCYWQGSFVGGFELPFGNVVSALFGASAAFYLFTACAYVMTWVSQNEVLPNHALLQLSLSQHATSAIAYVAMRMKRRTAVFLLFEGVAMVGVFWSWRGARDAAGRLGQIVDVTPRSTQAEVWVIRIRVPEPLAEVGYRIERHYL